MIPTGVSMIEDNRIQGELVRCDVIASGPMGSGGGGMVSIGGQNVAAASNELTLAATLVLALLLAVVDAL